MTYLPKTEDIEQINKEILKVSFEHKLSRTWKSDRYGLKAPYELFKICRHIEELEGDLYYRAAQLLIQLTKKHCFESANRRTAYYSAVFFLRTNKFQVAIKDEGEKAEILKGIREANLYTTEEIAEWLRTGEIKRKRLRRWYIL